MAKDETAQLVAGLSDGVSVLRELSSGDAEKLLNALRTATPTPSRGRFLRAMRKELPDFHPTGLADVIDALVAIASVVRTTPLSAEQVVHGLSESTSMDLSADERETLVERLNQFMSVQTLQLIAYGLSLRSGGDRWFYRAELVSDIRPVFGGTDGNTPLAAGLSHHLVIESHEPDGHRSYGFTLSEDDLGDLIAVLQDGKAKSRQLRGLVDQLGLTYVGPQQEQEHG